MTRCRSTSFYVSPGDLRYFEEQTLATWYEDTWYEFCHRSDLENFARERPEWDGVCYVGPAGGLDGLLESLRTSPERVEIWRLDARVINGRAPRGPSHTLFRLATSGVGGAGGVAQVIERLTPGANRPLRRAVEQVADTPGGHLALSVAVSLRPYIGDDLCAQMLTEAIHMTRSFAFAPVDPGIISQAYQILSERYRPERARDLIVRAFTLDEVGEDFVVQLARFTQDEAVIARLMEGNPSHRVWRALLDRDEVSPAVFTAMIDPDALVDTTTSYPAFGEPGTYRHLPEDYDPEELHQLLFSHAQAPPEWLAGVTRRIMAHDDPMRGIWLEMLAANPSLPPEILTELSGLQHYITVTVAHNRSTPPEILKALAERASGSLESRGSSRKSGSAGSGDEDSFEFDTYEARQILEAVAANPSTPPDVLRKLSEIHSSWVQYHVAYNRASPGDLLAHLAKSGSANVQEAVAGNPDTPADVLTDLSRSDDAHTRRRVAQNRSCPPQLLRDFLFADVTVASVAARNRASSPELLAEIARRPDAPESVLLSVAENPSTPPEALWYLVSESAYRENLRWVVAENPSAPVKWLEAVARVPQMREAVMNNPSLSVQTQVEVMADSRDPDIRAHAALIAARDGLYAPVVHPAVSRLEEVIRLDARCTAASDIAWPDAPRRVADLPDRTALPWDLDPDVTALHGRQISDGSEVLVLRPLESSFALRKNANYMGNCTAGYAGSVASGDSVILALEDADGKPHYNAELRARQGSWVLGEVNSRFNTGVVPEDMYEQLEQVVDDINGRRVTSLLDMGDPSGEEERLERYAEAWDA